MFMYLFGFDWSIWVEYGLDKGILFIFLSFFFFSFVWRKIALTSSPNSGQMHSVSFSYFCIIQFRPRHGNINQTHTKSWFMILEINKVNRLRIKRQKRIKKLEFNNRKSNACFTQIRFTKPEHTAVASELKLIHVKG